MKRYGTIKAGKLRKLHGRPARLQTPLGHLLEGHISVDDNGWVYLAHHNAGASGGLPRDPFGYEYGWSIYADRDVEPDGYSDNEMYEWIELA